MWQIKTGKLRDLSLLKLEELPLQKIRFRGKYIFGISENYIEKWLIRNTFNIYGVDMDTTYEEVCESDIVTNYDTLYNFMRSFGFKVFDLDEVVNEKDIENWTFDNVFEGVRLTPEEAGFGDLGYDLVDVGSIAFLLENIDPSTIEMKINHTMYDYQI